uniref:Secretagogin n=1 Tax=Eptatretus burgeri TaxID=7764 RepID=A0A8C4NNU1_EPTBU
MGTSSLDIAPRPNPQPRSSPLPLPRDPAPYPRRARAPLTRASLSEPRSADLRPLCTNFLPSVIPLSPPPPPLLYLTLLTLSVASIMQQTNIGNIDAGGFLRIWQRFDGEGKGYIEGKELDQLFRHLLAGLGVGTDLTEKQLQDLKSQFMSIYDVSSDGRLQIHEVANMLLPEDENFLLLFRQESLLDNSVEFMRIWRKYDVDHSGYISAEELRSFLGDLFHKHGRDVPGNKLDEYTDTMMKLFDRNHDGRLDLTDLARILSVQDNFLLQFRMEVGHSDSGQEQRRRDFEKIFAHYDLSKTGELEGAEVDGFARDMIGLVKPNLSGVDLDKFKEILLEHCDLNRDGKIQKSELALCLGVKLYESF